MFEKLIWVTTITLVICALIVVSFVIQFERDNPINPEHVRIQLSKGK